jgi:hypothetical protein
MFHEFVFDPRRPEKVMKTIRISASIFDVKIGIYSNLSL